MNRLLVTLLIITSLVMIFTIPASAQADKEISAKALDDHSCVAGEWHFVITQVDSESQAPLTIRVTWANVIGYEDIPLDKYTGKTAHYATTLHLDQPVTSATAMIYDEWEGQFNLSHGPCDPGTPQASYSIQTACWETGKDTASFVVDHVTLDIQGPGGPYVITSNTTMELEPGDYTYTATPDVDYQLIGDPEGEFSIDSCPVNGNHEEGSNGGVAALNMLLVIVATSFAAFVFKYRATRRSNPH